MVLKDFVFPLVYKLLYQKNNLNNINNSKSIIQDDELLFIFENGEKLQLSLQQESMYLSNFENKDPFDYDDLITFSIEIPDVINLEENHFEKFNEKISDILIVQDSYLIWDDNKSISLTGICKSIKLVLIFLIFYIKYVQ